MSRTRRLAAAARVSVVVFLLASNVFGQSPTEIKWSDGPSPAAVRALLEDELGYLGWRDKVSPEELDQMTALKVKAESFATSDEERKTAWKELLARFYRLSGAPPGFEQRLDQNVQLALTFSKGAVTAPGEFARVEKRGDGPTPMILIHDVTSDWTVFSSFLERNARHYTMYAVALPGIAGTSPYPRPQSRNFGQTAWLNSAEQAVINLIHREKLTGTVLVGLQGGAYLAMRTALDHPDKVKAVVTLNGLLFNPMNSPTDKTKPATREERIRNANGSLSFRFWPSVTYAQSYQFALGNAGYFCRDEARAKAFCDMSAKTPLEVLYRYFMELTATDLSEDLKKLSVPMLVVASVPDAKAPGAGGPNIVITQWEKFKTENAKSPVTLVSFEETRAYATEDSPTELDQAVRDFLAGKPVVGKTKVAGAEKK